MLLTGCDFNTINSEDDENEQEEYAVGAHNQRKSCLSCHAIGVTFSQSFDKWKPIFKRALPRDNRDETKVDLSINQLFTPKFSMQAVYSYMYSQGFLSSPYHYVLENDFAKFENYPETRTGHAFALKAVLMQSKDVAGNISYRYYTDDWGIHSHTINLMEMVDISKKVTTGVRLRYYTQSGSNFAKPLGSYQKSDPYFAIDYRMSSFDSFDIGIPFIYRLKHDKITASIDYYQTSNNDYIQNWYGVSNLKAVYTTLTYEFEY